MNSILMMPSASLWNTSLVDETQKKDLTITFRIMAISHFLVTRDRDPFFVRMRDLEQSRLPVVTWTDLYLYSNMYFEWIPLKVSFVLVYNYWESSSIDMTQMRPLDDQ